MPDREIGVPRGTNRSMSRKKKKLDKGNEARRLARKAAARPGATRVVEDRRRKPEKHRGKWLEQEAS